MANKFWMGFGGCKFEKDEISVEFPGAKGKILFVPKYDLWEEDPDGNIISDLTKYRAYVYVSKLANVMDTDYTKYQDLKNILNRLIGYGSTMRIYPTYDSEASENIFYDVLIMPDEEINPWVDHPVKTWQEISMNLISQALVELPGLFSDPSIVALEDGEGEEIWDQDDGTIDVQRM